MASKSVYASVSTDRIDRNTHKFKISTGDAPASLVASINGNGIITPPVLLPTGATHVIVSGFKRMAAVHQLGIDQITAHLLSPEASLEQCIHIAIIENALQRELNLVEQARAIALLDLLFDRSDQLCQAAGEMGMGVNPKLVEKLKRVNQMRPNMQRALMDGAIALPVALKLFEMEDIASADRIIHIICSLGLSLNRQRELVMWIEGISRRDGLAVAEILGEEQIEKMLNDPDLDRAQKSRHIRIWLKRRRYPEITETEERYHQAVKALSLEKGVQLQAPPHFEGQTYGLKLDFKDHDELVSKYQGLSKAVHSSAMTSLLQDIGKK